MSLDRLLNDYEHGRLSRRELLGALALLVGAGTPRDAAAAPIGAVTQMNHVSIFVPDVEKSKQFYQETFGLPLLTNQAPGVNLSTGSSSFLGIYPAQAGQKASINHVCFGMANFDADATLKTLTDRGVQARVRLRGDTKELYLTDPDGISVQLQDASYVGGTGLLGNKK